MLGGGRGEERRPTMELNIAPRSTLFVHGKAIISPQRPHRRLENRPSDSISHSQVGTAHSGRDGKKRQCSKLPGHIVSAQSS